MSLATTDHAAGILADLRVRAEGAVQIDDLPDVCRPTLLLDGYAIQRRVRELLSFRAPGPHAGWKIGCTTPKIQSYLGIPHPIAGSLYGNLIWTGQTQTRAADHFRLGLECELAVRLNRDLPYREEAYDRATITASVSHVMAAIELVDHRFTDLATVSPASLIADDSLSAGLVTGEPVPLNDLSDLAHVRGGFSIDDALPTEVGRGSDVLGHPLSALTWLADLAARLGTPLREGQIVSLGSLTDIYYPKPGQNVEARIDRLPPAVIDIL